MMRIKDVLFAFLIFVTVVNGKEQGEFFPKGLLVQPFASNIFEPRLGFEFHTNESTLELNISNSIEIYRCTESQYSWAFGAELFTFTRLRREANFHFPVDAIDYFFGVNFSYLNKNKNWGVRARLSHISAHFADGHYNNYSGKWLDNISPIVYSREFIELTPFLKKGDFRFYFTAAYVYHVDPSVFGKYYLQFGFDYFSKNSFLTENIYPFLGYDLRLNKLEEINLSHSAKLGLKFGKPEGKGLSLFLTFFSGNSFHGEYFRVKRNFLSVGFNLDI